MIIQDAIPPRNRLDPPKSLRQTGRPAGKAADPHPSDIPRSEFLKLVQQKIKKGYYGSDIVLDDLSNSFAGAFDKIA